MTVIEPAILPYDLPDAPLIVPDGSRGRCCVFVPERVMVVIGKGSDAGREVNGAAVLEDRVPVLRRGTGGCSVVLSPEMAAVSFALYGAEQKKSTDYFRDFNRVIMDALERLGVSGLEHRGISDITLGGRKIAGTAIYRNRELVFYHAIVNLRGDTGLMERYLTMPPREPEYRAGRSHRDFVTSLAAAGFPVDAGALSEAITSTFPSLLALGTAPAAP
jgi:lipoate-protein ligase A